MNLFSSTWLPTKETCCWFLLFYDIVIINLMTLVETKKITQIKELAGIWIHDLNISIIVPKLKQTNKNKKAKRNIHVLTVDRHYLLPRVFSPKSPPSRTEVSPSKNREKDKAVNLLSKIHWSHMNSSLIIEKCSR